MAKRKRSSKRPQPRHKKNHQPSQFDKRARLGKTNPDRKKTIRAKVSLAVLAKHPWWSVIALPLRSLLYVRAINVPKLAEKYGWEFRTKLQMAVELVVWFVNQVRALDVKCQIWMVADGAYASRKVLLPLTKQGVVVFSRLRRDAALFDLPPEPKPHQPGRPPIYGRNRISLSKRAGQQQVRNVWSNIACWHLKQWMYTLVELCSWDLTQPQLTDRRDRPWDNPDRRPSHADRRRAIAKEMLEKQFLTILPATPDSRKIRKWFSDVLSLCT